MAEAQDGQEIQRSPEQASTELVVVAADFLDAVRGMSDNDRSSIGYSYSDNGLNEKDELIREVSDHSSGQSIWRLRACTTAQRPTEIMYTLTTDSAAVNSPTVYEWSTNAPMTCKERRKGDVSNAASVDQINDQIVTIKARTKAIATVSRTP